MKAGIVTFHRANNYGAVLQAYAMITYLKNKGIDAELIDYKAPIFNKYKVFRTHLYKKAPYMLLVDVIKASGRLKRNKNFSSFRRNYMDLSKRSYLSSEDLRKIETDYDVFICGSDQIWNPDLTEGFDPVFFLDFVRDHKRKVSYAPSIALKILNEFQIAEVASYLESFSAISIREQEGIELLQPYCNKRIEKTCDPVFLPDISDYIRICSNKYENEKFIFLYVVGRAKQFDKLIRDAEEVAEKKKIKLYYLIDGDKTLFHIKGINVFGCSPSDFLSLIRNAQFVFSNSFHATALSILFSKQFVTFLKQGTSSRVENLLRETDMIDRAYIGEEALADIIKDKIDYSKLSERLKTYKNDSVDYLNRALDLTSVSFQDEYQNDSKLNELKEYIENRRPCYIGRHKSESIVSSSRSGGVFVAFSDFLLNHDGVVYGCKMDSPWKAIHARATNATERDLFCGSKYVQSEMGNTFLEVKKDLQDGKLVLFSGTGCQIAGLYAFLGNQDLTNLYTIDIVCHGVPSPNLLEGYIDWMNKKADASVNSINFRDKRYGWKAHIETVQAGSKLLPSTEYRTIFLKNAFLRPSCYECPFSKLNRKSDITIGDAWGVEKTKSAFNDNKGCSLIMINNIKGRELFNKCLDSITVENADLADYLQPNLYKPSTKPDNRDAVWSLFKQNGFAGLVAKYGKSSIKRRVGDWVLIQKHSSHLGLD